MDPLAAGMWGYHCGSGGDGGEPGDGCGKWLIAGMVICVIAMIALVYIGLKYGD